jgi:hypothetical protein
MSMTKGQIGIIGVMVLASAISLGTQWRTSEKLRDENALLKRQVERLEGLTAENERLAKLVTKVNAAPVPAPATNDQFRELMKLRGQVGTLRKTADEAVAAVAAQSNAPSVLSGLTESPEMGKMIRDQQKMGLGMIYKAFTKRANLSPELAEELNNVLADDVMTNINHITELLRAKKTPAEMETVFAAQEAELREKVKSVLGEEGFAQYQDYTQNLASYLTAEQFKGMLPGDKETKDAQAKQLYELMQQETKRALADAGLPSDYQTVPTLNFRNIASEEIADKNLRLLETIYDGVANQAGSFLGVEELEKFGEFRKMAINNNRVGLTINRKMMAPPAQ